MTAPPIIQANDCGSIPRSSTG